MTHVTIHAAKTHPSTHLSKLLARVEVGETIGIVHGQTADPLRQRQPRAVRRAPAMGVTHHRA